jgi:hypothetical protein
MCFGNRLKPAPMLHWTRHLFETAAPAQHRGSVTSSLRHHRCLLHDYNLYGTVRFP